MLATSSKPPSVKPTSTISLKIKKRKATPYHYSDGCDELEDDEYPPASSSTCSSVAGDGKQIKQEVTTQGAESEADNSEAEVVRKVLPMSKKQRGLSAKQ